MGNKLVFLRGTFLLESKLEEYMLKYPYAFEHEIVVAFVFKEGYNFALLPVKKQ